MDILVTGGCGFIGSHTVVELINQGYNPIIVDNLVNSNRDSLERIVEITGIRPLLVEGDIRDADLMKKLFSTYQFGALLHFAALKAVGESCANPFVYYDNNISGTINLLNYAVQSGCKRIIFSSSATVYDASHEAPFTEDAPTGNTTNPYGTTKLIVEQLLRDIALHKECIVVSLRYFNPIGAHESGLLGEDPQGIPNNLFPYMLKVLGGELPELQVFGNDYDTPDGTGVRDYIHIMDLALGHTAALKRLLQQASGTVETINVGTGRGTSVMEMIKYIEDYSGKAFPYRIVERRAGDVAVSLADVTKAKLLLGWDAQRSIKQAVQHGCAYYQQEK